MAAEVAVVLPGGQVGPHGVLALLPQHLLDQVRLGHVHRQDGPEARLPHGSVALVPLQLATVEEEGVKESGQCVRKTMGLGTE